MDDLEDIEKVVEFIKKEKMIKAGFNSYRENVMPAKLHKNQLSETEKAFYAGPAHIFGGFLLAEKLPETEVARFLQSIVNELDKFSASLMSKVSTKH